MYFYIVSYNEYCRLTRIITILNDSASVTCRPAIPTLPSTLMSSPAPTKRRRVQRSPSPKYKLDDEGDDYEPYIPVAQRRQLKLAKLSSLGASTETRASRQENAPEEPEDEDQEEEKRREKSRKERTLLMEAQEVHSKRAAEGE